MDVLGHVADAACAREVLQVGMSYTLDQVLEQLVMSHHAQCRTCCGRLFELQVCDIFAMP
jgi:hypothetical protein